MRLLSALALTLLLPLAASGAESAATLYALNCMGCHLPPEDLKNRPLPLGGQFAHSETGRVFFINVHADGRRALTPLEDAHLLEDIAAWKRSCSVILQHAPVVRYGGGRFVK
ncbi:MAG: hypothetical protein RLZ81_564 [Pseudomonadota bacterium]|jgi:hypothetical protein